MILKSTGEDAYFAASNSERGFFSYYKECFDAARVKRVFAVKGGPGTGKSRFLRDVAVYAEDRGWTAEYIYCSSDADSLDGVILTSGEDCIALLDATAPHVYEPALPGVREEIVNLGSFWNREKLCESSELITLLNQQKSAAYRRCYRYLRSEGELMKVCDSLTEPYIKREALRAFAEKQVRDLQEGSGYESSPALIRSVGMRGEVIFDTYFADAEQTVLLEDCYGCAQVFLGRIGEMAIEKQWKIRVSHDPVFPDRLDGLFLQDFRRAFVILPKEIEKPRGRVLSLRRFAEISGMRAVRGQVRFTRRLMESMREGALDALREVRELHFALEDCYVSAMDFEAKENFTKIFCSRLFDLKNQ
ncbi:MAG: hypothetical protein IJW49_08255 [Clostridia bacterium]|nr:hypothetical protein [Clostridia bacterium]